MSDNTSAADVQAALSGIDYPASREHLVEYAGGQRAPESVLNALRNLPEREYSDAADVGQAVSGL